MTQIPEQKQYFDVNMIDFSHLEEQQVLVLFSDVSTKLYNIRIQQLDRYKQKLLEGVNHNLKTPLHGILLYLDGLSQELRNSNKDYKSYIECIQINCHILNKMINEVIDFSCLAKRHKFQLQCTNFQIKTAMDYMFVLLNKQSLYKKIKIDVNYQVKEDLVIYNDQFRLQNILITVIGNIIQLNYDGVLKVEITEEISGDCFRISICYKNSEAAHEVYFPWTHELIL